MHLFQARAYGRLTFVSRPAHGWLIFSVQLSPVGSGTVGVGRAERIIQDRNTQAGGAGFVDVPCRNQSGGVDGGTHRRKEPEAGLIAKTTPHSARIEAQEPSDGR